MINLIYKINEIPTPPAAPPNYSFMSSIQIVPAKSHKNEKKKNQNDLMGLSFTLLWTKNDNLRTSLKERQK